MHNQGYQPAGYQPAGYQVPVQQTVVVLPATRMRGPTFLQQGVRVGGMMLGLSCVVGLGVFGGFFIFVATIMLATANYDDDFWDNFDRDEDPIVIVGTIFMVIGVILVAASIGVCFYARKKYRSFGEQPGRVINPNPGGGHVPQQQPAAYPPYQQVGGYPPQPQPAGYPPQPQPAPYPGGQPQAAGYPPQPYAPTGQYPPTAYSGQPQGYPEPTTSYPGPPAPYPGQSGDPTAQVDPSYPVKPQQTNMPYEYTPPPPHAPESHMASAPPPYKP